uniref:Uncharacterized protein n=1 Tax=Marseillevirus LCMAC101 TaxID=2506602 RepID=A0A481YT01_9VIRU|nr:MAG: hypothetical protein LCMAC101_02110 [Marseillevirus LCMAC101]
MIMSVLKGCIVLPIILALSAEMTPTVQHQIILVILTLTNVDVRIPEIMLGQYALKVVHVMREYVLVHKELAPCVPAQSSLVVVLIFIMI